jgi:hypothetical protein
MEKKKVYKMTIDENDPESGVYAISLVADPAIEELWVAMSKQKQSIKLSQVGDKQELIGLVLVPNKEIPRIDDATGEEYSIVFDEPVISKIAEVYMKRGYQNAATVEHMESVDGVSVIESWIVENPEKDKTSLYGIKAEKGSWAIKMKIDNSDIWNNWVKTGDVLGFSLEGLFGHELVEMSSQEEDLAKQKLAELKEVVSQFLETITSIDSSYAGNTPSASGSVK